MPNEARKVNLIVAAGCLATGIAIGALGAQHWPPHAPATAKAEIAESKFETKIVVPSKMNLTDNSNTAWLSFEFQKPDTLNFFPVAIKNLTSTPVSVTYQIRGYDGKDQRVSEGDDAVLIQAGEAVARKVQIVAQGLPFGQIGSSFRLSAAIRH